MDRIAHRVRPALRQAAAALCALLLVPALALARGEVGGRPSVSTVNLSAPKAEVFQAVREALSDWRTRKADLEEGVVKTDWQVRTKLSETYRGRIVAEMSQEGYVTQLTVRHENQRRMDEMRPTLGGPSAEWRDWDGNPELVRAVIASVQEALGLTPPPIDLDALMQRVAGPTVIHEDVGCVVPPETGARITALKDRRRDLVKEIKAMDASILDAVYAGKYEAISGGMASVKSRKATMEVQVTEIDREILSLVLAD